MHISHCRAHAIIGSMHLLEDALPIVHARYRAPVATVTHFNEFPAGGRILGKKFKSRAGKNLTSIAPGPRKSAAACRSRNCAFMFSPEKKNLLAGCLVCRASSFATGVSP